MKQYLIAPSILSADFARLGEDTAKALAAGADVVAGGIWCPAWGSVAAGFAAFFGAGLVAGFFCAGLASVGAGGIGMAIFEWSIFE